MKPLTILINDSSTDANDARPRPHCFSKTSSVWDYSPTQNCDSDAWQALAASQTAQRPFEAHFPSVRRKVYEIISCLWWCWCLMTNQFADFGTNLWSDTSATYYRALILHVAIGLRHICRICYGNFLCAESKPIKWGMWEILNLAFSLTVIRNAPRKKGILNFVRGKTINIITNWNKSVPYYFEWKMHILHIFPAEKLSCVLNSRASYIRSNTVIKNMATVRTFEVLSGKSGVGKACA
jgi:hypothetical protein